MNIRIQIIIAAVIILALCIITNMIRKKALELQYALAWFGVGTGLLILDVFPEIMRWLAGIMGIELPSNMLFFLGFCFSLAIIFSLTIAVSRMSIRIKNLTQEIALYMKREEQRSGKVEENEKVNSDINDDNCSTN